MSNREDIGAVVTTPGPECSAGVIGTFPELFRLLASDLGRSVLFALGAGCATAEELCGTLHCEPRQLQADLDRLESGGLIACNHEANPYCYLLAPGVEVDLTDGKVLSVKVGTNGCFTLAMESSAHE